MKQKQCDQMQQQIFGKDIQVTELRYHNKRVLVSKEFRFDAAHHLHAYEGKCAHLHGHTYRVVFGLSGLLNPIGMVMDFNEIKAIWKEFIEPRLDHQYLNRSLPKMNPTAENIVVWIYECMTAALEETGTDVRLEFVRLFETPGSYAEARRSWIEEE